MAGLRGGFDAWRAEGAAYPLRAKFVAAFSQMRVWAVDGEVGAPYGSRTRLTKLKIWCPNR